MRTIELLQELTASAKGGAEGSIDPRENVLGGAAQGIVVPMCLSLSGGGLSVSKQLSDDRQAEANGNVEARVSVAQVASREYESLNIRSA